MRKEQQYKGAFAKNKQFEQYLSWMNDALAEKEAPVYADPLKEVLPTIHVIGAPRSGTTLLTQLISSYLEVGYINNLIAAFWKAPLFGIHLSKKLLGTRYRSDFSSSFGRTRSIYEPHEFGYFWNYWLKYDDFQQRPQSHENMVDWEGFSQQLIQMTYAFGLPIAFKSFLLGFHGIKMQSILSKTCFILVERDRLENAASILKMRKDLMGDINTWVSMRPLQYHWLKERNPYEQVAGQVIYMQQEYEKQLEGIPESNKMKVSYEEICENPVKFLQDVKQMLAKLGYDVSLKSFDVTRFTVSNTRRDMAEIDKLHNALNSINTIL